MKGGGLLGRPIQKAVHMNDGGHITLENAGYDASLILQGPEHHEECYQRRHRHYSYRVILHATHLT